MYLDIANFQKGILQAKNVRWSLYNIFCFKKLRNNRTCTCLYLNSATRREKSLRFASCNIEAKYFF